MAKNKAKAKDHEKRLVEHQEKNSRPRRPPKNKVKIVSKIEKKMEPSDRSEGYNGTKEGYR